MPSRPFFCDDHVVDTDSYHFSSELNAIEKEDDFFFFTREKEDD